MTSGICFRIIWVWGGGGRVQQWPRVEAVVGAWSSVRQSLLQTSKDAHRNQSDERPGDLRLRDAEPLGGASEGSARVTSSLVWGLLPKSVDKRTELLSRFPAPVLCQSQGWVRAATGKGAPLPSQKPATWHSVTPVGGVYFGCSRMLHFVNLPLS